MTDSNVAQRGPTAGGGYLEALQVPKINLSRPAGEQILHVIQQAILHMDLPPGCIVSEAEIGAKFGSSRTPVREAFMSLREAGLIHTLPSRGNFVAKLNRNEILEARFLREGLEMANIRQLIIDGIPAEYTLVLDQNLVAQTAAAEKVDSATFGILDDAFHIAMAKATGYPRAAKVLKREKIALDRLRALSLRSEVHLQTLLDEHTRLYQAIKERDMEAAIDVASVHFSSVLSVLSDLVVRHDDYFDQE